MIEFQILVKTNRERSPRPWPNMIEITKYVNRIRERVRRPWAMIFTVLWKPIAKNRLTEIWIDASDRNAVTKAANESTKVTQKR